MRRMLKTCQQWRRNVYKSQENSIVQKKVDSEPTITQEQNKENAGPPSPISVAATTPVASDIESIEISLKKRVHFAHVTTVEIVPNREEYFNYNIAREIWWRTEDLIEFKRCAQK